VYGRNIVITGVQQIGLFYDQRRGLNKRRKGRGTASTLREAPSNFSAAVAIGVSVCLSVRSHI